MKQKKKKKKNIMKTTQNRLKTDWVNGNRWHKTFIWIQWNKHLLTFTSFETFAICHSFRGSLLTTSTSSFNECEVELFYAKFGAEKEIENQTQISVFSLFDLFNGKSQRKIEMRLKIKEKDKKKIKTQFSQALKFAISTLKMRPCNRRRKWKTKRNQTNTQKAR